MSDPQSFKDFEHEGWQRSVDEYDESFGRLTRQVIPRLLDRLQIGPGQNVLDVACGPGYLAAAAAARGADVLGIDFAEAMVARARTLYPSLPFREGDAEHLPLPDETFDAVAINFGILHLSQPELAFREAYRVLKPSGRFAFTVWAKPEEAVGFQIVLKAIEQHGNPHVLLPPAPPFFYYSDPAVSLDALRKAGFEDRTVEQAPLRWEMPHAEQLFEAFYRGTARTGGLLRRQTSEALTHIREAVKLTAENYKRDGRLVLPMPALVASGQRPAQP